jgi:hypothetical protein
MKKRILVPWIFLIFFLSVSLIISHEIRPLNQIRQIKEMNFKEANAYAAPLDSVMSEEDASNKLVAYLNFRVGGGVEYISSKQLGFLYEVMVNYQDQDIPVYMTIDGRFFVSGVLDIDSIPDNLCNNDYDCSDGYECSGGYCVEKPIIIPIPKSNKPKVELFVMSYCPYGLQMEKGIIPVIEALGTKADIKVRFVHYFMHGDKEEKETYTQVCIREEQKTRYLNYLKCFVEDGNSTRCIKKVGISKTRLTSCIKKNAKKYYAVDQALSEEYGVQGSPTLIINKVEANSARDPQSIISTICSTFNNIPSQCSKELSSENPSAGFGYGTGGSSGSCE